ncbi:rhomboid family intramembrane serine protease [Thermomonas sp.]|uniref:rhomboid family intramembrane serine protease n=1 Tax=Thermomonas sp. TaxID=1971895 RepID=UPI001DEBDD84|nr:rhomboid family intramembrane serine protease [Thermomonas sp.]MBZ0087838.1 rhomboid family intramembrane serine protease [Thermomonas sp.]MCO5054341.1 rhomboid family intramembrane serine protease [Thermomonas sp.]HRO63777.1 rhomboid family intramembrane serine protease [Thermomonas sp.]
MAFDIPRITKALLIANIAGFALQFALGNEAMISLMLWPWGGSVYDPALMAPSFMPWQLLSYAFLHGSFWHLAFNMLALVMFGAPLEYVWGPKRFLTFYLVCVVGAGICQLITSSWMLASGSMPIPSIGASGGVFGLLLAYGMLFPNQRVMLLFPPIPMKARTLVILYGIFELAAGFTGFQPGVAHFAHLGGMLFGWLLIRHWRGQGPFGGGRRGPGMRIVR